MSGRQGTSRAFQVEKNVDFLPPRGYSWRFSLILSTRKGSGFLAAFLEVPPLYLEGTRSVFRGFASASLRGLRIVFPGICTTYFAGPRSVFLDYPQRSSGACLQGEGLQIPAILATGFQFCMQ